jgi:hypothetical protein
VLGWHTERVQGDFGWIEPWYHPLVEVRRGRYRFKVDRTGEPWAARIGGRQLGGLDGGYRALTDSIPGGGGFDLMAVYHFISKGWGRIHRQVKFIEDGVRVIRSVPAARAASRRRLIQGPPDLARLYRGLLVWEYQRYRWRRRGDYEWAWERPALSTWNNEVNPGFFKLPIPGTVDDLFHFAHVRWWPGHYRGSVLDRRWSSGACESYRAPIAYVLDPEMGDWRHRPEPEDSGVTRRLRSPLLFNEVLRKLDRIVETECADDADDERNIDDRELDRPLPYDVNGRRVALEFMGDGSFAVHREWERRNCARVRGSIPFTSATSALCGVIGYRNHHGAGPRGRRSRTRTWR